MKREGLDSAMVSRRSEPFGRLTIRRDWTPRWYRGEVNVRDDYFRRRSAYGAVLFK